MWLAMIRALVGDDLFQQRDVGALGHGKVSVSSHAERDDAFVVLVALNALSPKLLQDV